MSALWNKELTDKGMRFTPRKTDKGYGGKVFAGGKGYDGRHGVYDKQGVCTATNAHNRKKSKFAWKTSARTSANL